MLPEIVFYIKNNHSIPKKRDVVLRFGCYSVGSGLLPVYLLVRLK
jgi:hypothetical protein